MNNEIMTDFEYAKWCMLNELDRLAIPDTLRKDIDIVIRETLKDQKQVEEKAKVLVKRR